jgi:hypothetical protein
MSNRCTARVTVVEHEAVGDCRQPQVVRRGPIEIADASEGKTTPESIVGSRAQEVVVMTDGAELFGILRSNCQGVWFFAAEFGIFSWGFDRRVCLRDHLGQGDRVNVRFSHKRIRRSVVVELGQDLQTGELGAYLVPAHGSRSS